MFVPLSSPSYKSDSGYISDEYKTKPEESLTTLSEGMVITIKRITSSLGSILNYEMLPPHTADHCLSPDAYFNNIIKLAQQPHLPNYSRVVLGKYAAIEAEWSRRLQECRNDKLKFGVCMTYRFMYSLLAAKSSSNSHLQGTRQMYDYIRDQIDKYMKKIDEAQLRHSRDQRRRKLYFICLRLFAVAHLMLAESYKMAFKHSPSTFITNAQFYWAESAYYDDAGDFLKGMELTTEVETVAKYILKALEVM